MHWIALLVACWVVLPTTVIAQLSPPTDSAEWEYGERAPPLRVATWVKGPAVTEFQPGKVYVVVFWCSWSPPCVACVPVLNRLQTKFGEALHVVAVSNERLGWLQRFLARPATDILSGTTMAQTWNESVLFSLGLDEGQSTLRAYTRNTPVPQLPAAYVVGKAGTMEWVGHPRLLDEPLQKIFDGRWDAAAFQSEVAIRQRLLAAVGVVTGFLQEGRNVEAQKFLDDLEPGVQQHPLIAELRRRVSDQLNPFRARNILLIEQAQANYENPDILNQSAWEMMTEIPEAHRDLTTAFNLAHRAHQLSNGSNPNFLDTLARAYFLQGNLEQAIELQRAAVALRGGVDPQMEAQLQLYEAELLKQQTATSTSVENDEAPPAGAGLSDDSSHD